MDKEIIDITKIRSLFPKLKEDADFKLTSPATPNYNCIAWAYNIQNQWMWPGGSEAKNLDGFYYWPEGVEGGTNVHSFIKAFELKGYRICDSWEHEDGFRKIALYVKYGTTECTHASRELVANETCGKWTSKLGQEQDIQHGNPFSIEGKIYGIVHCIMKQPFI